MHGLAGLMMHVITVLFFIGLAGSCIVIAISFVEDFHELFGPDDPSPELTKSPEHAPPR
jgi:hypothetical protein